MLLSSPGFVILLTLIISGNLIFFFCSVSSPGLVTLVLGHKYDKDYLGEYITLLEWNKYWLCRVLRLMEESLIMIDKQAYSV